jgi:hypothetical protein
MTRASATVRPGFQCPCCAIYYYSELRLESHMQVVHEGDWVDLSVSEWGEGSGWG